MGNWVLRNNNTGEVISRYYHTFQELQNDAFSAAGFFRETTRKGNKRWIRDEVKRIKERLGDIVYHESGGGGYSDKAVWPDVKLELINRYLTEKYNSFELQVYSRLISRFSGVLDKKFIVRVNEQQDLSELGLIYVSSKLYDPNLQSNIIIIDQDQLNYLKIAYPENTIWQAVDVNKLLKDLKSVGLGDES